ncbi:unnamed protein product [Caenorhabditis bovis]|uniref:Uncharacterized protein n=1 Tax=Caenorhabditis bovis TaxID=2654633 RepID=A0A8S1EIB0_9PELO|nr:unnamed protein product [Caenorhabditis bovis]
MMSITRLVFFFLVAVCAVALAAPKQMVFGFGKRSADAYDDELVQQIPMKRYKPKSFAMGFGKRANVRSFNMGFGKRSAAYEYEFNPLRMGRSLKDETRWGRKFSMGLGKRAAGNVDSFGDDGLSDQ